MSRVLCPVAYRPIILSDRPSARMVSRFLTTSGSKEPSLSLGVLITMGPYSLWTVGRSSAFSRCDDPCRRCPCFRQDGHPFRPRGPCSGTPRAYSGKLRFLPNSGSPFLNCSLAFAFTELSSSFVIVTILFLSYSKVLGLLGVDCDTVWFTASLFSNINQKLTPVNTS